MLDKIKNIVGMILVLLCLVINITQADQIDRYDSNITVLEDGTIDVVETIQISTNHEEIKLGITRDIPTHYYFMNKEVATPVNVLSVMRNGKPENFWTQNNDGYVEIFTGSVDNVVDNYLDKGQHTFIIHWQSKNHIRSFENYDELYINVIGHNWRLPINNAIVTLNLPQSVEAIQSAAYYGAQGRTDQIKATQQTPQKIQFKAPEILGNGKGFTVATGFTKGIVPSIKANQLDIVVDRLYGSLPGYIHPFNLALWAILFVLLGYYWIVKKVHNALSPQTKRVFTVRFDPPTGSLAEMFAILKPDNDDVDRAILAILLDLHTKDLIKINHEAKAIQLGNNRSEKLSSIEQKIVNAIKKQRSALSFEKESKPWRELVVLLRRELSSLNQRCYSSKMHRYWYAVFPLIIGMIISSIVFFFIPFELFFSLIFMGIALQLLLIPNIHSLYQKQQQNGLIRNIPALLGSIPFFLFGSIFVTVPFIFMMLATQESIGARDLLIIYCLVVITVLAIRKVLMKIYAMINILNKKYGAMHQELLEFKHFLQYTKYEEYKIITPDLFEQYLPYSIILGIENTWIKRYQKYYPAEFQQSMMVAMAQASHNSLGNSINSSSTASSSTTSGGYGSSGFGSGGSGSGGGGSSGGGSGGGGGGGR